jgi:polysaccharide deacetylase family protein (PEP-CTERM system associated)
VQLRPQSNAQATPFEVSRLWSPPTGVKPARKALTCDVEDYFQVSAFEHLVPRTLWGELECRIPRNVDRILQLFADAGAKGTFFTLGWVAEHFPEVVRRIAAEGHEIASHGMCHTRIWSQHPEEFREDAARAKRLLEDASGVSVRGYRAASWSLDGRTPWAHGILAECGYAYSSSVYPITHDHYGVPQAPTQPFYSAEGRILEIPATTVRLAGRNWPASGGGYFRLLPLRLSLWLVERGSRSSDAAPTMFYFHPWELDPHQPRMKGASVKARFRHYLNLPKFEQRLEALLACFEWRRMDEVFFAGQTSDSASGTHRSSEASGPSQMSETA